MTIARFVDNLVKYFQPRSFPVTYLAIFLAAIGGFAVGAVWYMSLAKPWMAAVGRTEEQIKADQNP